MPLKIAQLGQPVLREVAKPIPFAEIKTPAFQDFLDLMLETMEKSKGVGLAAPQVYQSKRIFIAQIMPTRKSDRTEPEFFINPRISQASSEMSNDWEGCLSFLELMVLVPRHEAIHLSYLNRDGQPQALELSGFPARVVQHEYDHLDGILTIDRAVTTKDIVKTSEIAFARQARGEPDDE